MNLPWKSLALKAVSHAVEKGFSATLKVSKDEKPKMLFTWDHPHENP